MVLTIDAMEDPVNNVICWQIVTGACIIEIMKGTENLLSEFQLLVHYQY